MPATMAAGRFRVAALAWAAARSGVCPDDPATVAVRSWASGTARRYQGSLFAVADFEDGRSLPTGPSTCLSEYLSAKVSAGVARSTLRNVVSAVRGAEDLGIMPPTVLPIHWRLAKGGLSSGRQPYFSPPALSYLAQAAHTREQRIALGLGCLSYVLWLRVSEAATIAPQDLRTYGVASFTTTKVGGVSGEKRPLCRWAAGWAAYLLSMVDASADPAQPFAERGASGLEEAVKDMLRNSRWSSLRWHAFRRGGCAACYHRGPHLRFLLWWGRWRRLQTALEYATRYTDPEVVGPLLLPVADSGDFVGSVLEVPLPGLWPEAMFTKESVTIKDLVKELDAPPNAGGLESQAAGGGAGHESSSSGSSESSSESSGSSLTSAGPAATPTKRGGRSSAPRSEPGVRSGGAFVVGGTSAAGRRQRGGGAKRKRGPAGPSAAKSAGGGRSAKPPPKRWKLPVVGGAVRVHGTVPGGPKVVLGGGSVGSRPATGSRLRGRGTEGRASPAGRPQKMPRRGAGPEESRPLGESPGGAVVSNGVAWKFRPRGEDKRNPISL